MPKNLTEQQLIEHFGITESEMELLRKLSDELWNGPYYIVDSEENATETLIVNDEPIYFGDYTCNGIIGDAFPKLLKLVEPLMERLKGPTYYEPDFEYLSDKEPEGYFDEDSFKEDYPDDTDDDEIRSRYWYEPEEYYELDLVSVLEELTGPRTAREIAYHF